MDARTLNGLIQRVEAATGPDAEGVAAYGVDVDMGIPISDLIQSIKGGAPAQGRSIDRGRGI